MAGRTPYQTIGPFFDFGLLVPGSEIVATDAAAGRHVVVEGMVRDGAGQPVPDAIVEIWQADAEGRYAHPADPRSGEVDAAFRGFGRCGTDDGGRFAFQTVAPGSVAGPGGPQAPHLAVGVLSRGLQTRLVTRMYFEGEPLNERDAVLARVPPERRGTLVARRAAEDRYTFDIVLQGDGETVFFDV